MKEKDRGTAYWGVNSKGFHLLLDPISHRTLLLSPSAMVSSRYSTGVFYHCWQLSNQLGTVTQSFLLGYKHFLILRCWVIVVIIIQYEKSAIVEFWLQQATIFLFTTCFWYIVFIIDFSAAFIGLGVNNEIFMIITYFVWKETFIIEVMYFINCFVVKMKMSKLGLTTLAGTIYYRIHKKNSLELLCIRIVHVAPMYKMIGLYTSQLHLNN